MKVNEDINCVRQDEDNYYVYEIMLCDSCAVAKRTTTSKNETSISVDGDRMKVNFSDHCTRDVWICPLEVRPEMSDKERKRVEAILSIIRAAKAQEKRNFS